MAVSLFYSLLIAIFQYAINFREAQQQGINNDSYSFSQTSSLNVKDYGAKGDGSTDDTQAIQKTINVAKAGSTIIIPSGIYKITKKIQITKAVNINGDFIAKTVLLFNNKNDWGIAIEGKGLGGSPTDGLKIENLNLWGEAKALFYMYGTALHRIKGVIAQNTSSCIFYIDNCQDFRIQDVDLFEVGNKNSGKVGAAMYVTNSNNLYVDYFRCEAPKASAIYVENSDDINFTYGKIDGNTNIKSTQPFVIADNNLIKFNDFHFDGAKNFICEIIGCGSFKFNKVEFNNSNTKAVIKADNISNKHLSASTGYLPGTIIIPSVLFRDCSVSAESRNNVSQTIQSLIYSRAQEPIYTDNVSADVMISNCYLRENDIAFALNYKIKGSYTQPVRNDEYVGTYLTHRKSGAKARIWANFAGGNTFIDSKEIDKFPNGSIYWLEYGITNGLQITAENLVVYYRTRQAFNVFAKIDKVSIDTVTWDEQNQHTKMTIEDTNYKINELKGMYIIDSYNNSYLIKGNNNRDLFIYYDQSKKVKPGKYLIQAGYSNKPIAINYAN